MVSNCLFCHKYLRLWVIERVEQQPILLYHAQFQVQLLEVAEEDIILNEDEVLVIRILGEDIPEDIYVGMEHALEMPSLGAIQMVLVEFLAYSCSNAKYLLYKLVVN